MINHQRANDQAPKKANSNDQLIRGAFALWDNREINQNL
jgi:hypothetical protein